mgnify:CR=1 FL=1
MVDHSPRSRRRRQEREGRVVCCELGNLAGLASSLSQPSGQRLCRLRSLVKPIHLFCLELLEALREPHQAVLPSLRVDGGVGKRRGLARLECGERKLARRCGEEPLIHGLELLL